MAYSKPYPPEGPRLYECGPRQLEEFRMEQEKRIFDRVFDLFESAAAIAVAVIFSFFALVGLIQTCDIDIGFSGDNNEHVSFLWDHVPLNLLVLAALLLLTILLFRAAVTRRTVYAAMIAVSVFSAVAGAWWVIASKAAPGADSLKIIDSARLLIAGDSAAVQGSPYFYIFPFQLGYLLYTEGMLRLLGGGNLTALALVNVACVVAAYWAVIKITVRLFDDPRVELLTAILLGLCMQPVFLCTFLYGFLPGLALAAWSLYFVIACMQDDKPAALIPAALMIAAAILLKKNYSIFLIAECLMLACHLLRNRRFAVAALTAGMIALSLLLPRAVQKGYERRLDASFGEGTPMSAWLVTGLRESSFCSGWFSSYTTHVLQENDMDVEKTRAQVRADLTERVRLFAGRPRYLASFMYHKLVSQWNEPAFQCIWSSAAGGRTGPVAPIITSIGTGPAGEYIHEYFNQLMQYVYFGLAAGLLLMTKKRRRTDARMIIPLILLGAAVYHALFEAKSQYALVYVPLMLPYAAYGLSGLWSGLTARRQAPGD